MTISGVDTSRRDFDDADDELPVPRDDVFRIAASGAGFFADAYDLFVINIAVDLMAASRSSYHQSLTMSMQGLLKSMALIGSIVGQVLFGGMADVIGRKRVFVTTCVLVVAGAILSASVVDTESGGKSQVDYYINDSTT